MPRFLLLPLAAVLLCVASPLPRPGADPGRMVADRTLERGADGVLALSGILAAARSMVTGKVIDVELESDVGLDDDRSDNRWVYEVEMLTQDNQVVELEFDATTGALLEIEGAPWPAGVPKPRP